MFALCHSAKLFTSAVSFKESVYFSIDGHVNQANCFPATLEGSSGATNRQYISHLRSARRLKTEGTGGKIYWGRGRVGRKVRLRTHTISVFLIPCFISHVS